MLRLIVIFNHLLFLSTSYTDSWCQSLWLVGSWPLTSCLSQTQGLVISFSKSVATVYTYMERREMEVRWILTVDEFIVLLLCYHIFGTSLLISNFHSSEWKWWLCVSPHYAKLLCAHSHTTVASQNGCQEKLVLSKHQHGPRKELMIG